MLVCCDTAAVYRFGSVIVSYLSQFLNIFVSICYW